MMADLTLVNLNMLYLRHMDAVERELHVPLGPLYLVSALEQAGLEVDFRDYQRRESDDLFSREAIADFCQDPAPVIGLSCMANLLPFTILAAEELRRRYPDRLIVLGGVGAKSVELEVLRAFPWIDVVAHGECESTVVELVRARREGRSLDGIRGLAYRRDGDPVMNPPAERIHDLDTLPLPAYHRIELRAYAGYGMVTSRGCPYPCTFCSVAPVWNHESISRTAKGIVAEMRHLHERAGVSLFLFQDEFFVSSKKQVMVFCDELVRSGLKVRWKAFGRVNLTDVETMDAMAACGCVELRYGIESGSARVLERTRKGFAPEQSVQVVADAVRRFPRVDTFFVWGFPFETLEDFHQTLFQMVSFRLMGARVLPSLLCYLPQTAIYEEYRGDPKFSFCPDLIPEYMLTGHEICHPSRIEIDEGHRWLFELVEKHPSIFPGFYHYDLEGNVRPKLEILRQHGFYPSPETPAKEGETESCGAHSPRPPADPRREILTRPS
jgi:anaerobic magnesium-protoporphyrin IX monomethyl ester cyclase